MRIFNKWSIIIFTCIISIMSSYPISAYAEETGWVEISVSVPEYFTDQIYIQLQETGETNGNNEGNYVQINRHNDYIGRIQLPVGTYEITEKYVYENPEVYNIELMNETTVPITVTSDSTATSVKLNCTVVPIEQLPNSDEEYADWIMEEAQKASESVAAESESEGNVETPKPEEKEDKGPLYRIVISFIRTLVFGGIIGLIGYLIYKKVTGI